MTAHMQSLGMTYDWNTKKTFFPLEKDNEEKRYATWRVGKRKWNRILVSMSKTSNRYFAHRCCKATFTNEAGSIYLRILPGWHFTTDGILEPVSTIRMASLSAKWMNLQRNHSVLDDVRFWANILSKDSDKISLDVGTHVKAEISSTSMFIDIARGIEGDYRERLWYEEPPEKDELKTQS